MPQLPIIAVVGATGAQGGGLARALLHDPEASFHVRALTRNPHSEKAAALAQLGAEVVQADLDDVTSLKRAFRGAYGAFCVTNYWEHLDPEKELAQASHMAAAADAAGLQHVIWSTLEDTRQWVPLSDDRMPTLLGRYKVPHFDAKGEANQFFTDRALPTTFLLTSFYWENFIYFGMHPRRGPDGALVLTLPMGDAPLAGIAAEDIGRCACGIFRRGTAAVGQTIGVAGDHLTGHEMAAAMGAALGQAVHYHDMAPAAYRSLGFPGADDLGNMFQVYQEFSSVVCGHRNIAQSRALNPSLQTFAQWLTRHNQQLLVDATVVLT